MLVRLARRSRLSRPLPHRPVGTVPAVARRAAVALLDEKSPSRRSARACSRRVDKSFKPTPVPPRWIELWLREQSDRQATLADWNKAIDAEVELLNEESPDTDFATVFALLERRLDVATN